MQKKHLALLCIAAGILFTACSKRTVPENSGKPTVIYNGKNLENTPGNPAANNTTAPANTTVKRTVVKRTMSTASLPKVIMVNDKAAKKNINGRLYYDINGHRYWRNYDDGKYYLFSQAMYGNRAFIPH